MRDGYWFSVQHDAPDAFDGRFEFDWFLDAHDDDANYGKSAHSNGTGINLKINSHAVGMICESLLKIFRKFISQEWAI